MKWIAVICVAAACAGCSEKIYPMIPITNPTTQQEADQAWHVALSPVNALTREELLQVIKWRQLYLSGIDNGTFHVEKAVDGNNVSMDLHFDRLVPEHDAFMVTVRDSAGQILRCELYLRGEVESDPHLAWSAAMDRYALHMGAIESLQEAEESANAAKAAP